MKWELIVDGVPRTFELGDRPPTEGLLQFVSGTARGQADVREVEPGVYSILIAGRSYEVRIEPGAEGYYAGVNGRRYAVEVRDPRRLRRARHPAGPEGRQKISSPMPGKVVRVLAQAGEDVAAGQGLIVVEAMKMQNEIRSPKAGRVVTMLAQEGAAVAGGETLAEVE